MKFSCEVICQDSIEVKPHGYGAQLGGFNITLNTQGEEHHSLVRPQDCGRVAHLLICASEQIGYEAQTNNIAIKSVETGWPSHHVNITLFGGKCKRSALACITQHKALEIAQLLKSKATVPSIEQELDGGYGLTDNAVFTKDEDGNLKVAVAIDSFDAAHENTFTITQAELRSLGIIS